MDAYENLLGEVSVNQHHDAITGTSNQHVVFDYQYKLQKAEDEAIKPMKKLIAKDL